MDVAEAVTVAVLLFLTNTVRYSSMQVLSHVLGFLTINNNLQL
jgi:hypothetical protein